MRAILTVAVKEFRDGLRNRWVIAATVLLAALALALAFLGSAPTGTVGAAPLAVTVVSLSSLTIFLVPLIALLLSYETIVGEAEQGTLLLALSYPLRPWQLLVGKFCGHAVLLALATVAGYGSAAAAVGFTSDGADWEAWRAFAGLLGSSILLGWAFLAIGTLISCIARGRGGAGGLAIGVWLVFVLLWDLALLAALVADREQVIGPAVVDGLLLVNPTDAFRLFNLAGTDTVRALSGMTGLGAETGFGGGTLLAAIAFWIAGPLALASLLFQRREP